MINFGAGFILLVIILAVWSIRVLREYQRGVVFQLGRYWAVKGPGLFFLIPVIQQMVKVDLRTVVLDVPPQDVITRDNVSVKVNAVVYFLVVDPQKNPRHGDEPGADVAHYLTRHGAKVVVEQVQSHAEPIAKVILAYAERHNTDLIVVGAYSHARTTEMIFGGVTRSLLRDAAVPLLIAH